MRLDERRPHQPARGVDLDIGHPVGGVGRVRLDRRDDAPVDDDVDEVPVVEQARAPDPELGHTLVPVVVAAATAEVRRRAASAA